MTGFFFTLLLAVLATIAFDAGGERFQLTTSVSWIPDFGVDFALGVIIFILGLLVSIALHEVGHLVPAKRFGVKVPEYFVGFGRTLWSTTRGETEYGIKALPLGGYVRLAGMYPPARRTDGRNTLVEEARAEARADLRPGAGRLQALLSVERRLVYSDEVEISAG